MTQVYAVRAVQSPTGLSWEIYKLATGQRVSVAISFGSAFHEMERLEKQEQERTDT